MQMTSDDVTGRQKIDILQDFFLYTFLVFSQIRKVFSFRWSVGHAVRVCWKCSLFWVALLGFVIETYLTLMCTDGRLVSISGPTGCQK